MTIVDWLQNLLPTAPFTIPGWGIFLIVLGWLIGLFWIMALMKAKGMADRKAEGYKLQLDNRIRWEFLKANSTGPQVTAKTLREDDA